MSDNITLPREVVQDAADMLEDFVYNQEPEGYWPVIKALLAALAAEPTKPEPVAWLSRDEARLALWKAINSREFGNPTDDKLILDHLRQQGLWIGKVTSPALAAEQPVPTDKDSLTVQSRLDAESFREERDEARALLNGVLQDIEALRRDAEQPKHPGYIIGSHWLETAYSRICAGEAEADVLRDIGLIREEAFLAGVQHLRHENERLREALEKIATVNAMDYEYVRWAEAALRREY